MALFPDEFKNTRMHRVGFTAVGIAALCWLLISVGVAPIGPCVVTMRGILAALYVDGYISSWLYFGSDRDDPLISSKT